MKLTSILLTVCCLQLAARSVSQTVTFRGRQVPLEIILQSVEKQTGFYVLYEAGILKKSIPVSIDVSDLPLKQFLDLIFKDQPFTYDLKKTTISIQEKKSKAADKPVFTDPGQPDPPVKISGRVSGANGQYLGGATVRVKGKNMSTLTDEQGYFQIAAESGTTLVISYVGYQDREYRVNINMSEQVNIVLSLRNDQLDTTAVVVVGYTSRQLSRISSSVSVVSGKQLNDVTSNDIGALLQGKAAGVVVSNSSGNPNVSSNITIRGSSSISAGSSPLYVVDGIIGGNANPNDIESVTILKDAAAAGLYGSRASNGVIIITTKTGRPGKTMINFNTSAGISKVSTGNLKMMNSQQLYDYQKTFFPAEDFERDRPASLLAQNTNWVNLAYRTAVAQTYELAVSGGTDKTRFYISGKYYKEQGTLNHNGNDIYNLRSNLSHNISSKLRLTFNINGSFRKFENEASGNYGALILSLENMPWDNPYNADGSIKKGTEPGWIGRENDNFLHGWQYNFDKGSETRIYSDINLDYYILPNLKFSTYNRGSFANKSGTLYYDVRSKAGGGLGALTNDFSSSRSLITSNRLSFDKKFGDHSLNVIAVAEGERNYNDFNSMYGTGFPPGLHVMEAAANIQKPANSPGNISENIFTKALVQADYNYAGRYFFVGSIVNESSSRFGSDNRSANFYTVGGSWILSNESFMPDQNLFDLLKLRSSYGITGNANIGDYQALGLYSYGYQYAGNPASLPFQLSNPALTWEKAKTFNIGLDISLFKRISVTVDWYDKTTKALLLDVPLPYTSGYSYLTQNIGSVKNKGLELSLTAKVFNGKDFKWETRFNIAFNRNRVLALDKGNDISQDLQRISVGHDLYSWYMRKWIGVDPQNGDPLWEMITEDANGNKTRSATNVYSDATEQFVGVASPDFTGGFFNNISFRRFSLNAFFNFVSGNTVWGPNESDGAEPATNSRVLRPGKVRWQKPGDIATEPKAVYGGNNNSNLESSRFLENGSYIRLRNIMIGYDLPETFLRKIKISNARIYLSGDNLLTLTKFSGMDPEVGVRRNAELNGDGGNNFQQDSQKYPISKKFLLGLSIGF